ncbi:MAG: STAS domain-containing protein [Actinobacteria bacterium]|nr:MAG: STAS domain-containing protein [Actinomycetota bacterium]
MTRLTASVAGTQRRNEAVASRRVVAQPKGRSHRSRKPAGASGRPNLKLAGVSAWTHTLNLTGELNHRSAHILEAEIERLGEEGVDGIILDLRGLRGIDATGVAVIAFRCELCKRRGNDFALIRGPHSIHREFERAGVAERLPFINAGRARLARVEAPAAHSQRPLEEARRSRAE